MNIKSLIASLPDNGLMSLFEKGQWHIDHGSLERYPDFMRPDLDGALSSIKKLGQWNHFDVGYRDPSGKYNQVSGGGMPAYAYYDMGALVRSSSIDEITPEAKNWFRSWAEFLNVHPQDLRLNSWAVKGASGIDWHFDPEDVIHFQIKGDKLFKFLRTPNTRFADLYSKRHEAIFKSGETFANAEEVIVKAGTITVIPRGVWHWSLNKSDESFAVALCVNPPSYATILTQALYKRLREYEVFRQPVYGSFQSQTETLTKMNIELSSMLNKIETQSVLQQHGKMPFQSSPAKLVADDVRYFVNHNRGKIVYSPRLKFQLDGQDLALDGDEQHMKVIRCIGKLGYGFHVSDIKRVNSDIGIDKITEILSALVQIGFLEFVDGVNITV